jgi:O6-methylguanine-DNA--protein-cysteine methyltransferase
VGNCGEALVEINAYLFGLQRVFTVDIDWACLDGFQRQVLRITCEIPYGQVSTYGAIAEKLGNQVQLVPSVWP